MARSPAEFAAHLRAEAALLHEQIAALDDFVTELPMTDVQAAMLKDLREQHARLLLATLETISLVGAGEC